MAEKPATTPDRNRRTLAALTAVIFGMGGLAYASVPLYRLFCQVTGFGGTTQRADALPAEQGERVITVRFDASVDRQMPWQFQPVERAVAVRVGENGLASYRATNGTSQPIVGTATYNVTPFKAAPYFAKMQCFCFTEQTLQPGETMDMPVSFFIDPEILKDRNLDDVHTITLSYTFFRAKTQETRPVAQVSSGTSPSASRP